MKRKAHIRKITQIIKLCREEHLRYLSNPPGNGETSVKTGREEDEGLLQFITLSFQRGQESQERTKKAKPTSFKFTTSGGVPSNN